MLKIEIEAAERRHLVDKVEFHVLHISSPVISLIEVVQSSLQCL